MTNKNELIENNIALVYHIIAKEYPTYFRDEDIIQSGMVGLCKAAEHWDKSKSKFSTYAGKCIRNEICKEFLYRKPHSKVLSLDSKVGENITIGEMLVGDDDVAYLDDGFYDTLSEDEKHIFELDRCGYNTEEIASRTGYSLNKVRKSLRLIKLKGRNFNGE